MSVESGSGPHSALGSLQGCFVDGSQEQRARERRIRRRALAISVSAQCAILAAIILIPLFGKPDRLAFAYATPLPPYYPSQPVPRPRTPQTPNRPPVQNFKNTSIFQPPSIPPTIGRTNDNSPQPPGISLNNGLGTGSPCAACIVMDDNRTQPSRPADSRPAVPVRIRKTQLESAMLLQRVEPVYPALAVQIHREGRVELHAIIATDGTIQSLQVISGDPLFEQSALNAVRQWRYRPTILNGQPVEIDTRITVIYSLQH
ncbi:MAG TPA: TonB family protein [Candidatus Acidoferrum sp.]|nr:TonB family protein [Candidatus Acidoferrum sp.]